MPHLLKGECPNECSLRVPRCLGRSSPIINARSHEIASTRLPAQAGWKSASFACLPQAGNDSVGRAAGLVSQIDLMVYQLYGLTWDEVHIINPEIEKIISEKEYAKFQP